MLDVPELQHAASLSVAVGVNQSPWPLIDPLNGLRRTHAQQEQRTLGVRSSEPDGALKGGVPRIYPFCQSRCGAFGTWNAVHVVYSTTATTTTTPFLSLPRLTHIAYHT